jgi:SAM-dependent methyltransferase
MKIISNLFLLLAVLAIFLVFFYSKFGEISYKTKKLPDEEIKKTFDNIYEKLIWGAAGDGSGPGSDIEYTQHTRNIIYDFIKRYKIKSMLDAPCGAMKWMPLLLTNLSLETNHKFKYFGVDVVESVINKSLQKFKNFSDEWKFKVVDLTEQPLPENYELIFSRDTLMHLPYVKVVRALKSFSRTKGAKYLLVGSFQNRPEQNQNIKIGEFHRLDLTKSPFNLKQYVETLDERNDNKHLIVYDIQNYLSKIDFDQMEKELAHL